ncbi:transketolase [Candidatus Peregrinibacteria bacterium]|nr:transketolase [Candidatus Peregrinibacteria bacterium]
MINLPKSGETLNEAQLHFLQTFAKSCRHSILQMVTNAQSGHPGGSLSCIDYLSVLYTFIIGQTGEKVVISNGHISPAAYSVLAEMGYIPKEEAVEGFRKIGKIYEGHITRHVRGVEYGTGPLGIGGSVASAFALIERAAQSAAQNANTPSSDKSPRKAFFLAGDGECQEGQVHEMLNFAKHHKLNNLIGFIDYNQVQLTDSLKDTLNINIVKTFQGAEWQVIEINAHDYQDIWRALHEAYQVTDKPVVLVGHSIMGQGSSFMQPAGEAHKADWHGKAPKPEEIAADLEKLTTTKEETQLLEDFRQTQVKWQPEKALYPTLLTKIGKETGHDKEIDTGEATLYPVEEITDCRTAYGKALLDLAKKNPEVIALTADLKGSVMTKFVSEELPSQYYECGIAEQHMVSCAGGFSIDGYIPFASTFGAFMSSRAKDQARVNDINYTNVKMVATHCGLSVGEDGPTHQAIDDSGSFLGLFNTMVIEPADPNQCDRIIRYIASHYGNFYVRMGRHKFPVITKEDDTPFYDKEYKYEYGRSDIIRTGSEITIAATGPLVIEALKARDQIAEKNAETAKKIEIVAVSSIKKFDGTVLRSIEKTGHLITAEDHNILSGLGTQLPHFIELNKVHLKSLHHIAPKEYQLSGTSEQLYHAAGIDAEAIVALILKILLLDPGVQ